MIVNAAKEISNWFPNYIQYINCNIYDNNSDNMSTDMLNHIYDNIIHYSSNNNSTHNNNILVHCFMGRSRSVVIVIYYLMRKHGYTYNNALHYIKRHRPIINPTCKLTSNILESI